MLFYVLFLLPSLCAYEIPEFSLRSLEEGVLKYADNDMAKRYFGSFYFPDDKSFVVGGMDFLYYATLIKPVNFSGNYLKFLKKSEKLSFGLEDDPLFLCQQDDVRRIFCGSHIRLITPLSSFFSSSTVPTKSFYSANEDILICATSGGNKGSSIYLLNSTSFGNLRQLNIEAASVLPDDDPFSTPHELFFKARMLCPEFPEQTFGFMQMSRGTSNNKSAGWVVGMWLRKIGLQLKSLTDLEIVPYEVDGEKDGRKGALSAKVTSTLFQPQTSILAGLGEFVALHSSNTATGLQANVAIAFLRQEAVSRVLFVDVLDSAFAPSDADVPFEKTFKIIYAASFVCSSSRRPRDCPRHGFCFSETFRYPTVHDVKVVNDTILALFSTAAASWGARSALCSFELSKLVDFFTKCSSNHRGKTYSGTIIDCDSELIPQTASAIFESEGTFSHLELVPHSNIGFISSKEGKLLKGHLKRNPKNEFSFIHISTIEIGNNERVNSLKYHSSARKVLFSTETAVYAMALNTLCSNYLRIRYCLRDIDCFWNFELRSCVSKSPISSSVVKSPAAEKNCYTMNPENVQINASQGSTVRLVCNPPCQFDGPVRWQVPAEMDKNKYLVMEDILVLFDLFAGRPSRGNDTADTIVVSCSTDNQSDNAVSLVNFSIFKTCGAFCQRNRNMEAWCLKTWKQKIGLPSNAILRV